ncbi:hypothetical protein [Nostoc sp. FACHB-152]|nr:hypothetical protein [Nostoc sp. FACHB-152]
MTVGYINHPPYLIYQSHTDSGTFAARLSSVDLLDLDYEHSQPSFLI